MADIVLSAGVRKNLLSLQSTAAMMARTQNRLATGKKVNTALDNPTNFFTASSLQSRSADLSSLLDAMGTGIKTLETADNGISAIKRTIESMQATLRQARQDKSYQSTSYGIDAAAIGTATPKYLTLSGGAVGATPLQVPLNQMTAPAVPSSETGTIAVATDADLQLLSGPVTLTDTIGNTVTITIGATTTKTDVTTALSNNGYAASWDGSGFLSITRADGQNFTAYGAGAAALGLPTTTTTNGTPATTAAVKTIDQLVAWINSDPNLADKVRASSDNGKLRIENQSTSTLSLVGINPTSGTLDGSTGSGTIGGNLVRADFANQFNGFIDQLNKLSDDSSFGGINLLRGDKLKITFNEYGSSSIVIQAHDVYGNPTAINCNTLGITQALASEFDSDANIDARLAVLGNALSTLRSHASAFGSNLSIVQNREDFTKAMMNTLTTGADNLVLADTNEEGANMLALQTRQSLSTTALSLSAQADQAVLRLFG